MQGKIANNESCIVAADHFHRYEEDIQILKELNHEIYRMSIDWSRIEPQKGVWSQEGIDYYKKEITLLKREGIMPLLTLHHFSCPQWFQEMGGWVSKKSVSLFLNYVIKIVTELGELVNEYCTINESNVLTNDTYMDGKYSPGEKGNVIHFFKATKHLIQAHYKCYDTIHDIRKKHNFEGETKVGFAVHLACLEPSANKFCLNASRNFQNYAFHTVHLNAFLKGKLPWFLGKNIGNGKIYSDYLGVNYYSRHLIVPSNDPTTLFGRLIVDPAVPEQRLNDLGWEIYPQGLEKVIVPLYKKYQLPVHITENGIPDAQDKKRAQSQTCPIRQVDSLMMVGGSRYESID